MNKYIIASFAVFLVPLSFGLPNKTWAAGGNPTLELAASKSSSIADGSSKITFTVYTYYLGCENGYNPDGTCTDGAPMAKKGSADNEVVVVLSGSGNKIGGTSTAPNGATVVRTGGDGKATFTLASTVAESKTVKVHYNAAGHSTNPKNPVVTVSYSAPKPKPTPTPTPAPVVEPPAPESPKTSGLEVDNRAVTGDKISVPANQSLTLKGTTVANGVVKLLIFSEPKEVKVTADAQGNWSYAITGLEPGDHHVEAEVTDPATNKTSGRATLAAFTVEAAPVEVVSRPPANNMAWLWWGVAGALAGLGSGAVFWWLKKRKAKTKTPPTPPEQPLSMPPQDDQKESTGNS